MRSAFLKRSLAVLISVITVMSVAAASFSVSVNAALTDDQKASQYNITINDVTRKYPMAKQLLDGINATRSSLGLSALKMDRRLLEESMVRAAELPLRFSKHSLANEDYSLKALEFEEYSSMHFYEGVFIVRGTVNDAVSAFFDDSMYKNVVRSSYAKEIGIGAVEVAQNGVTFVCLRSTDEKTSTNSFSEVDPSVYTSDVSREQLTKAFGMNLDLQDPPSSMTIKTNQRVVLNFDVNELQGLGYKATIKPGYLTTISVNAIKIEDESKNAFTAVDTGTYKLRMKIDALENGTAISKLINLNVEPGEDEPVEELVNESYTNAGYLSLGSGYFMYGQASGGTGIYKYAFYYKKVGGKVWRVVGTEFGDSKAEYFTPSLGDYDVKIVVKDSAGTTAEKTFSFNVQDGKAKTFENLSTISTTGTPSKVGVYLFGGASVPGCRYAYYYKRTNGRVWRTIGTEFSATEAVRFTPGEEGEFNIKVDAINENNEIVSRCFALSVDDDYNDTGIYSRSSVSTTTLPVNTRIVLTGAAEGGTEPYTYGYFYKNAGANTWKQIGDYTEDSTAGVKLRTVGDYIMKIVIKDSAGGMISENFDVVVE